MFDSVESVVNALDKFSKETGISHDVIVVGGGGCMLLRGMRKSTNDLNIWVEEGTFRALADKHGIFIHPMVDVVLNLPEYPHVWIRKHNPYFQTVRVGKYRCYNLIAMITFKRGGYSRPERSKEKRDQDLVDIQTLNELYKEEHRVKEVA